MINPPVAGKHLPSIGALVEQFKENMRSDKQHMDLVKESDEDNLPDLLPLLIGDSDKHKNGKGIPAIPAGVSLADYEKYGFYEHDCCYFFRTNHGPRRGSNFIMEPLFHIVSMNNSKRLYKITNEHGFTQVIELLQKDLISISSFKLRVESLGNFLFEGNDADLCKLKRYLYDNTESCNEIVQLGWQKDGFWAWSNGISSLVFMNADCNGIVRHADKNYYLPSSSAI